MLGSIVIMDNLDTHCRQPQWPLMLEVKSLDKIFYSPLHAHFAYLAYDLYLFGE